MKVVLVHPEIPQNCGNVVRTCSVTGCSLTLVRPLGFAVSDRRLKRAGLDYWEGVDVEIVDDLHSFLAQVPPEHLFLFSSHATQSYSEVSYSPNSVLVFGSESAGLPEEVHADYQQHFVRIPMLEDKRCLNLATSVGVAVYEGWRQQGFLLPE